MKIEGYPLRYVISDHGPLNLRFVPSAIFFAACHSDPTDEIEQFVLVLPDRLSFCLYQ